MAERSVLIIDPDRTFATQLSSALTPYGVQTQILTDGKDVPQSSPLEMPCLVLLCVEPKSVGYAICNKLKKSPLWKSVPVILMSAEATQETFEQHKKLKTRADDYIRKPFEMNQLLDKVHALIGLTPAEEVAGEAEPIEEIMLDDDEMAVVEEAPSPVQGLSDDDTEAALAMLREMPEEGGGSFSGHTSEYENYPSASTVREGSGLAVLGGSASVEPFPPIKETTPFFDTSQAATTYVGTDALSVPAPGLTAAGYETPAALDELPPFEEPAALEALSEPAPLAEPDHGYQVPDLASADLAGGRTAEPAREVERIVTGGPGAAPGMESALKSLVPATATSNTPILEAIPIAEAPGRSVRDQAPAAEMTAFGNDAGDNAGDDAYVRELQARTEALEAERNQLRQELEEARKRLATRPEGPTFQKEREFLALREQLNRKDRELLDLREQNDTKDRENLDLKEQTRELDRKRRELEERLLGVEQQILAAQEETSRVRSELGQAQRLAVEQQMELSRQLAQAKSQADQLVVEARRQAEAECRRVAEEQGELRSRLEQEQQRALTALREEQAGEVASLHQAHEQAISERQREQQEAVATVRAEMQEALANAAQSHSKEQAELIVKHQAALRQADEQRRKELQAQTEQHKRELEAKANEHRTQTEQQGREHAARLEALRVELAGERQQAEEALRAEMAHAVAEQVHKMEEQRKHFDAEKAELQRNHHSELADVQQTMRDQKMGMERRHLSQVDELKAKHTAELTTLSHELTQRDKELATARAQLSELQNEVTALRAHSSDLEGKLTIGEEMRSELEAQIESQATRVVELERQNSGFQDQVLKALGKIRSDAQLAEKARKALAIAAALLEEQGVQAAAAAGNAEAQVAPPAKDKSDRANP